MRDVWWKKGGLGYRDDMIWRELRDADIRLGAAWDTKIGECIIAKRHDAKFITYHSLVQGIAFNFQVGCHKCFSSYYQVKESKQDGSLGSKGGYLVIRESRYLSHYQT